MPDLLVENLCTKFNLRGHARTVVDDVSFVLKSGKTLAIVGESGCGKTVLALSLMQILPTPPALSMTGKVIYQDVNLLSLSQKAFNAYRGKEIAMIFQDPTMALNPVYTIGDQLIETALLHFDMTQEEAEEKTLSMLFEVGIAEPAKRMADYPHQLSGGMKQRVMIAMALMSEPKILIADEPTTALDVTVQVQILQLIKKLQKKRDMSLLLITHDMGVVAEMADDVIIMYAGQFVEGGPAYEIFDQKDHPYTQGLFNSRPAQFLPGERLKAIKGSVPAPGQFPSGCRFHPRCPFVMPKCKIGEVPFFSTSPSHFIKCWLFEAE